MNIEIITTPFQSDIFGFGSIAINREYAATAFKLSGRMWDVVKTNKMKNQGKNIWVYDNNHKVFAGVELDQPVDDNLYGLEKMQLRLEKYAYYKHIGSYGLIKQAGQNMTDDLKKQGYEVVLPYVEIYGHWNNDESKLETELLMNLR